MVEEKANQPETGNKLPVRKDQGGSGRGLIEVLSQHFPGGTE
jgi:hypothetical protein